MTLPVYTAYPNFTPISLNQIQTEFGGSNPISLTEYYAGSLVPAGTVGYPSGNSALIPATNDISLGRFYGASQKDPAGSQTFYSSGTFNPPRGYTSVNVSWYDNNGYSSQIYSVTYGTPIAVSIVGAGSGSQFNQGQPTVLSTQPLDREVFWVNGAVDAGFWPQTTIYNNSAISTNWNIGARTPDIQAVQTFNWNGQDWYPLMNGYPAVQYYDYYGVFIDYPGDPHGLIKYFNDRYGITLVSANGGEVYHGELNHSIGISTFPKAAAYGGSVYITTNIGRNNYYTLIDTWNATTGYLGIRQLDDSSGEGNYYTGVNYRQPVWIKVSWP